MTRRAGRPIPLGEAAVVVMDDTLALLERRTLHPEELPRLRQAWWSQRRHYGTRLPAEAGTIVLDGGRP